MKDSAKADSCGFMPALNTADFVLTYLIDALLAAVKTPLALGLMAVFTEFPFF